MMLPTDFMQIAWVVPDLGTAMRRWIDVARVGPFFVNAHASAGLSEAYYRGQRADCDYSLAIAQAGPIQIELIEQHNIGSSVYRDSVPSGCEGLHHMASFTEDIDAEIARYRALGAPPAFEGYFGDMYLAYVDTRPHIGFMIELLEHTPAIDGLFRRIADESVGWDGSEPIRPFPVLA
jgi:hypothetical protein